MIRVRVKGVGLGEFLAAHGADGKLKMVVAINDRVLLAGDAEAVLVDDGVEYDVATVGPSEAEQWLAGVKK